MSVPVTILALALLALVVLVVSAPLRAASRERMWERISGEGPAEGASRPLPDLHELHTRRDAKYREIRDAELDFRTGKLSSGDYEAIDAQLRAEALEILDRIEASGHSAGEEPCESKSRGTPS
ncbi:MAG TPA: hypothetical protein VFY36_01410 [Solirubrobacteraceae bacterium]|nr:hypothetical protein [Solirubrobacteraceae bacterium]